VKWIIKREKWFNPSIAYFIGEDVEEGSIVVVENEKKLLFLVPLSRMDKGKFEVRRYNKKEFYKSLKKDKRIGVDFVNNSADFIREIGKKREVVDISEEIEKMREVKKPDEIRKIKEAEKITKEIFEWVEGRIREGISEIELKKMIVLKILEMDKKPAFDPIVLFGRNSSIPHNQSGKKRLRAGEIALIDFGVKNDIYCSDITRCFELGNKEGIYNKLILICKELGREKTIEKVRKRAVEMMEEYGFPKLIHSIGHGIGIEVHERPYFSKFGAIKKNSVYCLEPAVYYKNFGLRYEDMFYHR